MMTKKPKLNDNDRKVLHALVSNYVKNQPFQPPAYAGLSEEQEVQRVVKLIVDGTLVIERKAGAYRIVPRERGRAWQPDSV